MGPDRMNSLFRGNNLKPPFLKKIQQSCFLLVISANESKRKNNENLNEEKPCISVELRIEPKKAEEEQNSNGAAYELIVDYKLVIGPSNVHFVEKDCWKIKEAEQLAKIELEDATEIEFCELFLNIRQTMVPEDLNASTSFRNFNVLSSERSFYVNTNHLNSFGGRMFKEWFERNCQGEQSAVVQSLNADELEELLKTCCQSTPIIHRRNFHLLLEIAEKEHIIGLLRLLESYLIDSKCIHPIRKLEYAAEYKMTRLATIILKSFPNRLARLDSLFGYLTENGESFGDVHLDVLEMLDLHYDYAIL